jgi:hypothetical protein
MHIYKTPATQGTTTERSARTLLIQKGDNGYWKADGQKKGGDFEELIIRV